MANVVRIKRRVSGLAGAPSGLKSAELAYNMVDDTVYAGKGDDGSGNATSVVAIAGSGTFALLASPAFSGNPTAPTQLSSDDSTRLATTAFVKAQGYLTGNQSITVSGDATGSGTTAITLTLATVNSNVGTYTKVTVNGKGLVTAAENLSASDIPTLTASKISDFDTQVRTSRLDQMSAPTADVSLNSQKITNLADPVSAQDAATKAYVDATKQGLDVKDSVRAATTGPITLSNTQTVDGVALTSGDRVLVKDQSTGSQNGIYVVASGSWTRAADADSAGDITGGSFVFVEEGSVNADTGWVCTNDGTVTIGTTALTFTQFSGAGQLEAGSGLTKVGNTLAVGAGTGITVNADDVALTGQALALHNLATNGVIVRTGSGTVAGRTITGTADKITVTDGDGVSGNPTVTIASTYAGQNTIVTLGTVTTGTWNATAVALQYGGTGANLSGATDGTIFKKSGTALIAATAGSDYLNNASEIDGGTF